MKTDMTEVEIRNNEIELEQVPENQESAAPVPHNKFVISLATLLAGGVAACSTESGMDNRAPAVSADIAVGDGFKVHFHGSAVGVQIYTWDGSSWGAAVPEATLFDSDGNIVAIHFAGPTWESNSGSRVVGMVVPPRVTVDTNAIPWLKLQAASTSGSGVLADTKYIQRVNTAGGLAPSTPGAFIGQVARTPYTADYYFYRKATD
jgi:hypothetical protein